MPQAGIEVPFAVADVVTRHLEPSAPASRQVPSADNRSDAGVSAACSCRTAAEGAGTRSAAQPDTPRHCASDGRQAREPPVSQPLAASEAAVPRLGAGSGLGGAKSKSGCRHFSEAGLSCSLPEGVEEEQCLWVWLGDEDAPALTQLMLTHSE
jgi:hypothetical protein